MTYMSVLNIRPTARALVMGVAALCFAAAVAPGAAAQQQRARYDMKQVENGFLRLDTTTGAVSFCRRLKDDWVCRAVADDRRAYEKEIARLQTANEQLRRRLGERNDEKLPGDAELDRVMNFLEKVMRRFIDFARSMRDSIDEET